METKSLLKSKTFWTTLLTQGAWAAIAYLGAHAGAVQFYLTSWIPSPFGELAGSIVVLIISFITTHFRNDGVKKQVLVKGIFSK